MNEFGKRKKQNSRIFGGKGKKNQRLDHKVKLARDKEMGIERENMKKRYRDLEKW